MQEKLISIITPMYKGASLVSHTIKAVIAQTYKNWELIIVDDCSPDEGEGCKLVEKFSDKDKRVKLIQGDKNRGSSGARNQAIKIAHGKYLAFLDSDDIWEPKYLEVMMNYITRNKKENAAIFFSGYKRMNSTCSEEILPPYSCEGEKKFKDLLYHCPIFPSAAIIDLSKIGEKVYFREELRNLRDDYAYWLDITKKGYIAIGFSEILVKYRMSEGSLTAHKNKMIKPQWNIYRKILGMNIATSFFYLCSWAFNGIKKYRRLK